VSKSKAPKPTSAQPEAASAARSGTQAEPYVRADGQATRSTTVHFPVELHQKLRVEAAKRGVHMSSIVAEAVREWFAKRR
jgi:hypothetical protein